MIGVCWLKQKGEQDDNGNDNGNIDNDGGNSDYIDKNDKDSDNDE